MFKQISIVVTILVVGFFVAVAMQPNQFRITRSIIIAAPSSEVFIYVNNLHNWNAWSPWAKMDPNSKIEYAGPAEGLGASFKWEGNDQVGVGIMTIAETRVNEYVRFRLDFLKPFVATNTAEFTFKPQGNETEVSWSMSGKSNFMSKAMSLIMNCDKMVGGQFEKGLADLKALVERNKKS